MVDSATISNGDSSYVCDYLKLSNEVYSPTVRRYATVAGQVFSAVPRAIKIGAFSLPEREITNLELYPTTVFAPNTLLPTTWNASQKIVISDVIEDSYTLSGVPTYDRAEIIAMNRGEIVFSCLPTVSLGAIILPPENYANSILRIETGSSEFVLVQGSLTSSDGVNFNLALGSLLAPDTVITDLYSNALNLLDDTRVSFIDGATDTSRVKPGQKLTLYQWEPSLSAWVKRARVDSFTGWISSVSFGELMTQENAVEGTDRKSVV